VAVADDQPVPAEVRDRLEDRGETLVHAPAPDARRPNSFAAFSFMISGRTSSLIAMPSKSFIHRSGVMTGKSEPKSTLCFNSELAYCTSCGGKYFGDHPERSMYTCGLCVATDSASSCHGNDGWARMIGMSGESTATSSTWIGVAYFPRIPPPAR